ncbi:transposase [Streptomyces rishiriensis]|uniref:transposase n=1 Tax=Streptomyces rishiriensis TaxID=68264 RepID=UPI0040386B26
MHFEPVQSARRSGRRHAWADAACEGAEQEGASPRQASASHTTGSRAAAPLSGRLRLPDRTTLEGVMYVLRTGVAWRGVPAETVGCSGVTAWRRLRDRTEAGVRPRSASGQAALWATVRGPASSPAGPLGNGRTAVRRPSRERGKTGEAAAVRLTGLPLSPGRLRSWCRAPASLYQP